MFNRRQRRGFSLIELLIVIAIILIIITIAVPKYNRTQMYMRETAAIKAIQTIHQVEVQYQSQYGRFATSLTELGPPASGNPTPAAADLIGNDLANGLKQGYKFTVTGVPGGYQVNANPEVYGSSGSKSFFSDQTMVIRENNGPEPATANSKEYGVGEAPAGAPAK
ncbi:MAG TPA: prepilin-type N-terminal cleavage/methylation domain-containing protein [Bryobacteraceae bacterium]|nr:prepilin-type N-terminal cleavage/methylation domain-containing protein [Bryobacteraceae bacterium]